MAWTGYVTLDDDKPNVGLARTVWDEGGPEEFSYSRRVAFTGPELTAFVADAKAARQTAIDSAAANAAKSIILTDAMNA